ncbi:MAG: class I SAM-dependent methyltransferase, partial [Hyphomonadaceae bacterium]|nr:class I SAM-dependent methyltransferase [Hyphomonadaceae bacterium]
RQYVATPAGWREKQVGIGEDGALMFGLGAPLPLPPACANAQDEPGQVRDVAPGLAPLVDVIAARFEHHIGRALFIDYGDITGAPGDSLQALHRHNKCHPLDHVGEADLTAHVDFNALVTHAHQSGLKTHGPISQRAFLQGLGIEPRAQALIVANPHCANDVHSAVERLIGTEHMGALFNVVCMDSTRNDGRGPPLGI